MILNIDEDKPRLTDSEPVRRRGYFDVLLFSLLTPGSHEALHNFHTLRSSSWKRFLLNFLGGGMAFWISDSVIPALDRSEQGYAVTVTP